MRDSGHEFYRRLLRDLRDPRDVSCGQLADSGPFRSEPDKFLRNLRNFRESLDSPRTSQAGIAVEACEIDAVEKFMDECRSLSRQHRPAFSAFRVRPLLFKGHECDTDRLADAIHDLPAGVLQDLAVTFEALAAAPVPVQQTPVPRVLRLGQRAIGVRQAHAAEESDGKVENHPQLVAERDRGPD